MDLLQENGVDAYFSRCLTLTFSRREQAPSAGKIYIVEGRERLSKECAIPEGLAREAEYRNHYIAWDFIEDNDYKRRLSTDLLDEYRTNARLVITNLLHCAMPCL